MPVEFQGGDKYYRTLRRARRFPRRLEVEVGFFASARYEDGTSVSEVAATHEFGLDDMPERPFFRRAVARMKKDLEIAPKQLVQVARGRVNEQVLDTLGAEASGIVQQEIIALREPPNSPVTIARKSGRGPKKDNPLIDTSHMLQSASWRVGKQQ